MIYNVNPLFLIHTFDIDRQSILKEFSIFAFFFYSHCFSSLNNFFETNMQRWPGRVLLKKHKKNKTNEISNLNFLTASFQPSSGKKTENSNCQSKSILNSFMAQSNAPDMSNKRS